MTFNTSGLPLPVWIDILDASQLPVDLSLTTHKIAVYTDTKTPNYESDASYSATTEITNVSGTGYTAGGKVITTPTTTSTGAGTIKYDHDDESWTALTAINLYGAVLYADALAAGTADAIIYEQQFGAGFNVTAGTFTIQESGSGVVTIDTTP